jgi:hypothetical protein
MRLASGYATPPADPTGTPDKTRGENARSHFRVIVFVARYPVKQKLSRAQRFQK